MKKTINITGTKAEAALRNTIGAASEKLSVMLNNHTKRENASYMGKCYKYTHKDGNEAFTKYLKVIKADGDGLELFCFFQGKQENGKAWFYSQTQFEYAIPNFWTSVTLKQYRNAWASFARKFKRNGDSHL